MKILSGLNLNEIEEITDSLHASKFRARQIHNWIYLKSVKTIDEMTDLSIKFREELKQIATVTDTKIKVKQESVDGTLKYLLEFPDGECVETVLMRFDNRANLTACVSSQVGGTVNCEIVMADDEVSEVNKADADFIIALNQASFDKFLSKIKQGGMMIANSTLVKEIKTRTDINYLFAPITKLAEEVGNIKMANILALGIVAKATKLINLETLEKALDNVLTEKIFCH